MGLADRDYIREQSGGGGFRFGGGRGPGGPRVVSFRHWSFNTWLIVINVAVFVLGALMSVAPVPVHIGDRIDSPPPDHRNPFVVRYDYARGDGSTADYLVPVIARSASGASAAGWQLPPAGYRAPVNGIIARELYEVEPDGSRLRVGYRVYRMMDPLTAFGHFSTAKAVFWWPSRFELNFGLEVWRLITFQFLHAGVMHIFFNMFGLFVFGRRVEEQLGFKRYAAFYLMCGLCGGLMYLVLSALGQAGINLPFALFASPTTPLVGASAGVFGVIMAAAYIEPNSIVQLLFPPIPLKLKWFAYGYVALALANLVVFRGQNQGGDAAHVGGAIAGAFFIRRPGLLHDFFVIFGPSKKTGTSPKAKRSKRDKEVDRILDKINREGVGGLSAREKQLLEEASRTRRER